MTIEDEANLHLANTYRLLRDADEVRAIGKYAASVSMSYYAVFHAAKSILVYLGEGAKTHRGTNARFHYRVVYNSDFPANVSRHLGDLQTLREGDDYEPQPEGTWRNDTALEAIARAEQFVSETESWFARHRSATG